MFTRRDGGGQPIDVRGQVHDDPIDRDLRERLEERLVRDLAGRRATLLPTDLAQLLEHPPQAPAFIVVEGQGALSHPANLTSAYILRGARPDGVIVQHAPLRGTLGDYPAIPMPTAASEIALIEAFARTRVIGVTINHENMTDQQVTDAIDEYELEFGVPATDPLTRPIDHLVEMVFQAYPTLRERSVLAAT